MVDAGILGRIRWPCLCWGGREVGNGILFWAVGKHMLVMIVAQRDLLLLLLFSLLSIVEMEELQVLCSLRTVSEDFALITNYTCTEFLLQDLQFLIDYCPYLFLSTFLCLFSYSRMLLCSLAELFIILYQNYLLT